jgi:hypothetical protein
VSGNNSAPSPKNGEQSSKLVLGTGETVVSAKLQVSGYDIDDAIGMHLVDCSQCRAATERGMPVAIGQKSGHCDAYWQLQLMRADYEGQRNNVVAYTEFGDEAPKSRPLD